MTTPMPENPRFRPARSSMIETEMSTAFFGRRKGKTLSPTQQRLIDDLLPRLCVNPTEPIEDARTLFAHEPQGLWLEIGFGGGEHLVRQAESHPDKGLIGCEPFVNGMVKALSQLKDRAIGNVRLYDEDAAHILDWLPEGSLERIFLLYPDPWHKKRHWKRRFVSDQNLKRMVRVLKPGGVFRFASDIEDYVRWTLDHVAAIPQLEEQGTTQEERLTPWSDWLRTRYEEKAIREGRRPQYLEFLRGSD